MTAAPSISPAGSGVLVSLLENGKVPFETETGHDFPVLATSPTSVGVDVVAASRELSPPAIVELTTFVSLAQLLHRLESYYVE